MKLKKVITLILILLMTAIGSIIYDDTKADHPQTITYHLQAQSADSFVESLGINTKFGYCPGHLCDNYAQVKDLLAQLGIRYIRDIPYPESWRIRNDLYQDHGIQMLAEIVRTWGKSLDSEKIRPQLQAIKQWGKMIVGIVGVNEYDNPVYQSCAETEGCDPEWSAENWAARYGQFQQRLYRAVKSDPELENLPLVLGPLAHLDNIEQLGNMNGSCDRGNDHSYPGAWGKPSQESGWGQKENVRAMDTVVSEVQKICPGKQLWITETGYDEASDGQHNQYLVTRTAKAKYLPRIYANYFQQGQIEKTFLYELIEPTQNRTAFGIIDTNLKPTPAYYAIKNMVSLLGEATWDSKTQSWNRSTFQPQFLKYTLKGDRPNKHGIDKNIKHLLLQKSDQTFYLLIWQEVYVYDNQLNQNLTTPDRVVDFQLDEAVMEEVNAYLLHNENNPSGELSPLQTWKDVSTLTISVPDHILALEFTIKKPH